MCPLYIMSETWLHSERAFSTFTNKRVDLTIAYPSDMLKKKKKQSLTRDWSQWIVWFVAEADFKEGSLDKARGLRSWNRCFFPICFIAFSKHYYFKKKFDYLKLQAASSYLVGQL